MSPHNEKIKIIVCEDQPVFRKALHTALSSKNNISILTDALNGLDLLQKLEYFEPDIILLNIQMPVMDGITALPIIKKRFPAIKIIILSFLNDPSIIRRSLELGANSYVTKERGIEDIYEAIINCYKKELFINNTILDAFTKLNSDNIVDNLYRLNEKELAILRLLKKGKKSNQIAESVDLSNRTVEAIIDKLKHKTNSKTTRELIKHIPKKKSPILKRSKRYIKSSLSTFFNALKYFFLITIIVGIFFIPRINDGLTPVDILAEKIHERSKYNFNGSVCNDGHISRSQGRGTCSWHGGVRYKFYKGEYKKTMEECIEEAKKKSWRN